MSTRPFPTVSEYASGESEKGSFPIDFLTEHCESGCSPLFQISARGAPPRLHSDQPARGTPLYQCGKLLPEHRRKDTRRGKGAQAKESKKIEKLS